MLSGVDSSIDLSVARNRAKPQKGREMVASLRNFEEIYKTVESSSFPSLGNPLPSCVVYELASVDGNATKIEITASVLEARCWP